MAIKATIAEKRKLMGSCLLEASKGKLFGDSYGFSSLITLLTQSCVHFGRPQSDLNQSTRIKGKWIAIGQIPTEILTQVFEATQAGEDWMSLETPVRRTLEFGKNIPCSLNSHTIATKRMGKIGM